MSYPTSIVLLNRRDRGVLSTLTHARAVEGSAIVYRQGDVLLVPVPTAEVPATAVPAPRDRAGRMVLARGEATGHAHVIVGPDTVLLADRDDVDRLFVKIITRARVVHEEHGTITVPAGSYRIIRQREYVPGAFRYVAD
jgi:hypothetical protein